MAIKGSDIKIPDNAIFLWPDTPPEENFDAAVPEEELEEAKKFRPWLEPYLIETDQPRPAIVLFPGGGYAFRVQAVIAQTVKRFNDLGFHVFACQYRTKPHRAPAALLDAARAVRIVRANAQKWQVKADGITVLGYSAGGHLAAHISSSYNEANCRIEDDIQQISCRPDAFVSCYGVLSHNWHTGSFKNLLGEKYSEAEALKICPTQTAHENMPPAFIWSTAEDETVPVESALDYAKVLRNLGIEFHLHIYPHGPHSLCLADDYEDAGRWSYEAAKWLDSLFGC